MCVYVFAVYVASVQVNMDKSMLGKEIPLDDYIGSSSSSRNGLNRNNSYNLFM